MQTAEIKLHYNIYYGKCARIQKKPIIPVDASIKRMSIILLSLRGNKVEISS